MNFNTTPFKVNASTLSSVIMKRWVKRRLWLLTLPPVVALFYGALVDLRFVFIALIMIFIIIPPIMMIVYFYHALSPSARYSILFHSVTATPAGLRIDYVADLDTIPADTAPSETIPPRAPDFIPVADIASKSIENGNLIITLNASPYSIIIIPIDRLHSTI